MDFFGGFIRNLLDVHAARGRGHHHRQPLAAIDQHGQIQFLTNAGSQGVDKHFINRQAFDLHPQDGFGIGLGLFRGLGNLNTAGLASPTGQDLRFDNRATTHVPRDLAGFLRRAGDFAGRNRYSVFSEQPLGLILM